MKMMAKIDPILLGPEFQNMARNVMNRCDDIVRIIQITDINPYPTFIEKPVSKKTIYRFKDGACEIHG